MVDIIELASTYVALLNEVLLKKPAYILPETSIKGLNTPISEWDEQLARNVFKDLSKTLRGAVEDLGYDPDMLPEPPQADRFIDYFEDKIVLIIPDPEEDVLKRVKMVPSASWNAQTRVYTVEPAEPVVEPLRNLVRFDKFKVTPEATTVLRTLAAHLEANPNLANVATVSVEDKKVYIRFNIVSPNIADDFKRVPSTRWDGVASAFIAPLTRLREIIIVAKKHPVIIHDSAKQVVEENEAEIVFDGTLDGLTKIPVDVLNTVKGKKIENFAEFGIETIFDLLMLTPRRYLDRSNLTTIRSLQEGQEVGLLATVASIQSDPRKRMVRIGLTDNTGKITATYFNAIWQAKRFRVGDEVSVYGKVDAWQGSGRKVLSLSNPVMDPVGDETLPVIPIYPQSAKSRVTTWEIQSSVLEAFRRIKTIIDPIPESIIEKHSLISRIDALRNIHTPTVLADAEKARERLAFDELFRMQTALLLLKNAEETEVGVVHEPTGKLTNVLLESLPFGLTGAQQRVIKEIESNLKAAHPAHRLIQGDVGAGKSLIAIMSLLTALESGFQGALMAPTEILATQLFNELVERTDGLTDVDGVPLRIEFFSNKLRGKKREEALEALVNGDIHIAVGTHALLVDDVLFKNLGLAVIDEQHRFGVDQRAKLRNKGPIVVQDGVSVHLRPDMLVMTATPIPRTAAMTVFGDLDISILDEMPPGRTPIETSWIDAAPDLEHSNVSPWDLIREEVAAGRQAYVVCPLVEESEKLQVASAVETFEMLAVGALKGLTVGLVHGQMKSEERSETMEKFRNNELNVLVATTVIEVGVNVPNATVMVILDSGRFGIAQLHQLRGRVGRGVHASKCVLVGRCVSSDGRARMEALVESTDGFWLSEVDLSLRGHGQVFGSAQSGQSDLRVADLDKDKDLLVLARKEAILLLNEDGLLEKRPQLREEIATVLGPESQEWLVKS